MKNGIASTKQKKLQIYSYQEKNKNDTTPLLSLQFLPATLLARYANTSILFEITKTKKGTLLQESKQSLNVFPYCKHDEFQPPSPQSQLLTPHPTAVSIVYGLFHHSLSSFPLHKLPFPSTTNCPSEHGPRTWIPLSPISTPR